MDPDMDLSDMMMSLNGGEMSLTMNNTELIKMLEGLVGKLPPEEQEDIQEKIGETSYWEKEGQTYTGNAAPKSWEVNGESMTTEELTSKLENYMAEKLKSNFTLPIGYTGASVINFNHAAQKKTERQIEKEKREAALQKKAEEKARKEAERAAKDAAAAAEAEYDALSLEEKADLFEFDE